MLNKTLPARARYETIHCTHSSPVLVSNSLMQLFPCTTIVQMCYCVKNDGLITDKVSKSFFTSRFTRRKIVKSG